MQSLMDKTIRRLFLYLKLEFSENNPKKLVLIGKYGFDGTNVPDYKQLASDKGKQFSSIMCTSVVPLMLLDKTTKEVYWSNPHPSSTSLCRPIEIDFQKETDQLCRDKAEALDQEIAELEDIKLPGCSIEFDLRLTMVDGKVIH